MDVTASAVSLSLAPEPLAASPDMANVRTDASNTMGADFQSALEGFRQKSANVEAAGRDLLGTPGSQPANANERAMRQLTDLYTYAVDMQVLVRTSGQLTSGIRQLVTGQ